MKVTKTPWQQRRLTARTEYGKAAFACSGTPEKNAHAIQAILDRLAEYEDLAYQGRLRVVPKPYGTTCATCENWERIEGTRRGTCKLKPKRRNKFGKEINAPFEPAQSYAACRDYEERETET